LRSKVSIEQTKRDVDYRRSAECYAYFAMRQRSQIAVGLLLGIVSLLQAATCTTAQQKPKDASSSSQEELERLQTILAQFTSRTCQDVNPTVTILISNPKSAAQLTQDPHVSQFLNAGVTLEEYLTTALIIRCLAQQKQYQLPPFLWAIQKTPVINASADFKTKTVVLTTGMLEFTRGDPGELAFVIAHELGHLSDQPLGCGKALEREKIAIFTMASGLRECEQRADNVGFQYLVGAGFNAYDAPAFFGRFQMIHGQPGFLTQFALDHPIDSERIEHLRNLFVKLMQTPPNTPVVR
jgi:predicted Zn-dependent protease